MPSGKRFLPMVITLALVIPALGAADDGTVEGIALLWHWERADGTSGSHGADEAVNPASLVKLATTLWALEALGPDHRFRTTFEIRGEIDEPSGVLRGDLRVVGNGDPDFHVENAQLVARSLADAGIRKIEGSVYVNGAFWIGWERGSDGRIEEPERRARLMAKRLADAWDPRTWTPQTLRAMRGYRERAAPDAPFVHIEVSHVEGLGHGAGDWRALLEHVSNPVAVILKRLNDYSNNDIERLEHGLGDAAAMTEFYRKRWGDPEPAVRFETLSGLGSNRLSPRQVVRLLGELHATAARHGLRLADLLPSLGCGRNTLRNYPRLVGGLPPGGLVAKTGTLVQTDGGVVALAGWLTSERDDVVFCVEAPRNGARMEAARRAQSRWLLERAGGWDVTSSPCGPVDLYPYSDATVTIPDPVSGHRPDRSSGPMPLD